MSKLTVTIPDDLHQKIREELERQGITTSQFIEQAVTTFFEKPKGVSNMATRTLAFQVSEELLQRIKTFLARYEQIYHRKLSQKEFLAHLIERELDEAEKDYERITTEQAAEENADVDSGEPDGTEMEVDTLTTGCQQGTVEVCPVKNPIKSDLARNTERTGKPGAPMHTLTTKDRHGVLCEGRIRRLTPRECLRLQGWADDRIDTVLAIQSDNQAYKQAGNGVTVHVVEAIGRRIAAMDAELRGEALAP